MISIGDTLNGTYKVVGRLGSGGYGEVFLAADEVIPGRELALKVLSGASSGDHSDLIWEMRTLSQFNHPGIVIFHHHFTHADQLVLVMEYCDEGSLDLRLRAGGPLSQDETFRWAAALCDTLAFVHARGIVHHDIKPANVLFSRAGAIKLGDFGVANRHAGTRVYMPPEMLLGQSVSRTDPRVDIYSLGLTVLEMLSGTNPFQSLSLDQALASRISHDFVPSSLPRWVQDILLRATHPTPELRFQTMADFGEAITSKDVPYVFDSRRIKAHELAEKSESQLARKKWKYAEKLAHQALRLAPDSAAAMVAAGRCNLRIRRTDKAREYFSQALSISPRIHVQKELGWLNLEEGHLPVAISLLSDHLDRNASDLEAYNLLIKCFFLSGRYEAGEDLARVLMNEKTGNDCFRNNRFICRLLNGGYSEQDLNQIDISEVVNPFIAHNLSVAREKPSSWEVNGTPSLPEKLVLQEYEFGIAHRAGKTNSISIRLQDGSLQEISAPIITIGALDTNTIALPDRSVSRRHALIVNFPNEVWLYDLGSKFGTYLNEYRVSGRIFLDGVHRLTMGQSTVEVAASADLLV